MMAIDGLGGSTPPLTPPAGGDVGGTDNTNGENQVTGAATPKVAAPIPNVISPAISTPKANVSPLDRPKIELPADMNLSVGDLIQLIQSEIKKTSDALAEVQKSQIKADTLKQTNANDAQIKALNDAADQIAQIQEEQAAMADVQWALMAVSIFLTVCTAGGLGPFIGPIMVAATVVTQVPIEGKNFSGWLTEGIGKGLGEFEKACEKSVRFFGSAATKGKYGISDEDMKANDKQIEDSENYQAMAVMTAFEVTVAIVVAVVTFGAAAGPAAGAATEAITEETLTAAANEAEVILEESLQTAMEDAANTTAETLETVMNEVEETTAETTQTATNQVTSTVQETAQTTLEDVADSGEDVEDVAANSAKEVQQLNKIQKAFGNVQTVGGAVKDLALDGVNIHTSYLQYENSENQADADKIKAYTKFLQQVLSSEEDFLKQIIESQSNIADTVKSILQTEHSTNMHIASLTTHA